MHEKEHFLHIIKKKCQLKKKIVPSCRLINVQEYPKNNKSIESGMTVMSFKIFTIVGNNFMMHFTVFEGFLIILYWSRSYT